MRSCTCIWRAAILTVAITLLGESGALAQTETGSPFSAKGLGELAPRNYARNFSMGGVGVALPATDDIDPSNPGHYGNLVEPGLNMGVRHDRIMVTDGELEETKKNTQLQNIAFGFPAADRWTLVLGIQPMAQRNYHIEDTLVKDGIGEYAKNYVGKGRLQKLFIGNGYNIIQQGDSLRLGIGVNVGYLFGELTDTRKTEYESAANFNTKVEEEISLNAFVMDAGIHFQKRFGLHPRKGSEGDEMVPFRIMAGATVDVPRRTHLERSFLARTYTGVPPNINPRDTTSYTKRERTSIRLPLGYSGGIAMEYDEKLKGSFEFRTRQWGSIGKEAGKLLFHEKVRDRRTMRAGFEFTPQKEYSRSSSYFAYWDYRVGIRSTREYYSYNGQEIRDLGISFGFGLPLVRSSSYSSIDLGAEWSRRGPEGSGAMLRERAWKIYLGVSLAPQRADQWFRKPKIR